MYIIDPNKQDSSPTLHRPRQLQYNDFEDRQVLCWSQRLHHRWYRICRQTDCWEASEVVSWNWQRLSAAESQERWKRTAATEKYSRITGELLTMSSSHCVDWTPHWIRGYITPDFINSYRIFNSQCAIVQYAAIHGQTVRTELKYSACLLSTV